MLKRILDDSRKKLVQDLRQKLGEVRVALVRSDADEEHQKALGRAIVQLDDLFLLVVVGEFNAGKSAVINALVGERVLEEGVTPTTSRIQLLRYGAERTRTQRGGDYEELTLPVAILRETCVVDTPGTNAVVRGHEALTREFVPRSDLVLFIRDWGKKLVVAINKTDILEKPDDVRKVTEFVREKLRELLGLRPEVFAVSARQASRTKAAGVAPDANTTGFGALEAYLTRTLDDAERLRVKLQSPLGVAERVLDQTGEAVKARVAAVGEDEAALKELESLRVQQLADVTKDLRLRLAEAERPLLELEKCGDAHLERRRKASNGRVPGPPVTAPPLERARLVQSLTRDCHRALDGFDAAGESARMADSARGAAWATLLFVFGAVAAAAFGLARAGAAGAALPWLAGAGVIAAAALLPLSLLRARERRRFAAAASGLRQRYASALRSGYEGELESSQKRVQDAMAPFTRHVRSESERVRGQAYEVGARRKDVDALRAQVAALR